jgi:hypothetical protein
MTIQDITQRTTEGFAGYYTHFKEFQQGAEHRVYWDKCVEALTDRDFLVCAVFCNDVFAIPPVKTFLTRHREDFIRLTGDERAVLDTFVKRAIGAFWGMVFKFVLGYSEQKSVSVSMNDFFQVKTASVYGGRPGNLQLDK